VPAGVVLAITPFNDPLNLVAHKVGPALAAGNTVILKPHEATPLSALHLARAFVAAGLPDAFLQVITGEGREIGDALVGDPRVRVVSFTGGRAVGARLPAIAGLKRLQLELGGNAPTIVMPSADLAHAAESCASGAYWAAGQNCLHVQRIFVHAAVARRFRERFVAAAARRTRGPKLDEKTAMGPQLSEQAAARVATRVRAACRAGARLLAGGTTDGAWHPATVIERVPRGHTLFREEIFGPVTLIEEIRSLDEAVQAANATPYGLHAAIFTRDVREAFRATRDLDCGAVLVNESSDYRIDAMPFGGTKASGLGREGVRFSIDAMSEPKVVCFDMSARK
jgi:glyceraldehyde-3-phosphate dehydrogenase (NADP+)